MPNIEFDTDKDEQRMKNIRLQNMDKTPKVVKFVMKWQIIKTEKQAYGVVYFICAILILISIALFHSALTPKQFQTDNLLIQAQMQEFMSKKVK